MNRFIRRTGCLSLFRKNRHARTLLIFSSFTTQSYGETHAHDIVQPLVHGDVLN
jgi:hypothetical protein